MKNNQDSLNFGYQSKSKKNLHLLSFSSFIYDSYGKMELSLSLIHTLRLPNTTNPHSYHIQSLE